MTPHSLSSLEMISAIGVDAVIDVRSPSEYAEDHLPGSINLPVLSDEERAHVGTIYTQQSPFLARKIGAALVARNTARHLEGPLADISGAWQPLVYCWRGGQRSNAFATILDQVGWRVHLMTGGYRSYRRMVTAALYDTPLPHRIQLIEGGTGTGKTALLHHLRAAGAQILDLEGLAGHRGSLFGALDAPQPSQKAFESQLAAALQALDPTRLTWVESESSRIGARIIPPSLWSAMGPAPRLEVSAPLSERATFLTSAYHDLVKDPDRMLRTLEHLRPFHAATTIVRWQALAVSRKWDTLAGELMEQHYDPRYAKSQTQAAQSPEQVRLSDLGDTALAKAATDLAARFT